MNEQTLDDLVRSGRKLVAHRLGPSRPWCLKDPRLSVLVITKEDLPVVVQADQAVPSHLATRFTVSPPAVTKWPPA